ncbi:MAG: FHA domain-containing protein [Deltaproteobacteria bacterium]|nr:FHA domain-containing protein [Deltaproteobacteria bacterium]
MAKDGDDTGFDEHTRIGGAPPKLPGAPQVSSPPSPPTPAAPASPAPPLDESTRLAATPPPMPKTSATPGTIVPTAPAAGGDFAEHTILLADLQPQAPPPARLQRVQPPGRSDIVTLERAHYLMGRLPSCDLRLYSQTASREHAQLTVRDGHWYLTPVTGKVVLVDGTQVKEEVPLTHKMRVQLGGDELIFLDERGAPAAEEGAGTGAKPGGRRWLVLAIGALVAAALWLWGSW